MTRHKVNTLLSLTFFMTVNCRAAEQAVGKASSDTVLSPKKTTNIISELSVPFFPTISDEAAHLVQATGVPGFRNEFGPGEDRVGFNVPQHRRGRHHPASLIPPHDPRYIKTEAHPLQFLHPIKQAVHQHSTHERE